MISAIRATSDEQTACCCVTRHRLLWKIYTGSVIKGFDHEAERAPKELVITFQQAPDVLFRTRFKFWCLCACPESRKSSEEGFHVWVGPPHRVRCSVLVTLGRPFYPVHAGYLRDIGVHNPGHIEWPTFFQIVVILTYFQSLLS